MRGQPGRRRVRAIEVCRSEPAWYATQPEANVKRGEIFAVLSGSSRGRFQSRPRNADTLSKPDADDSYRFDGNPSVDLDVRNSLLVLPAS